jgi:hypothetical protein
MKKFFIPTCLSMKMEQTECPEMLAYKIQMPGNYPEESMQRTDKLNEKFKHFFNG